jgi:hypothetical protein
MGVNRSRLRTLQNKAAGDVESFRLKSGQRYFYDRQEAALSIFMYGMDQQGLRAGAEPERLPEFLRVVLYEAENPRAVLETFRTGAPEKMFVDPLDFLTLRESDEEPL